MTETTPNNNLSLEHYQIDRLLRAFHADVQQSANTFSISYEQTPRKTELIKFQHAGGFHSLEIAENVITHTFRHGTEECKTILYADPEQQTIKVGQQIRKFDFDKGELGEPEILKVKDPLATAEDILHMQRVVQRTMEAGLAKLQAEQPQR